MSALLTQSPGDTVQTGTEKVDPAREFKCTATRELVSFLFMLYKSTYWVPYFIEIIEAVCKIGFNREAR